MPKSMCIIYLFFVTLISTVPITHGRILLLFVSLYSWVQVWVSKREMMFSINVIYYCDITEHLRFCQLEIWGLCEYMYATRVCHASMPREYATRNSYKFSCASLFGSAISVQNQTNMPCYLIWCIRWSTLHASFTNWLDVNLWSSSLCNFYVIVSCGIFLWDTCVSH